MNQKNCAEIVDRVQTGVARGMLVCGVTYLVLLAEVLTAKGRLNEILDFAAIIGSALTVIVTFVSLWPVIKQKLTGKSFVPNEPESFISGAMLASFKNGWIALTLTLVFLLGLSKFLDGLGLPLKFYFVLLFAVAVLSASISFFWLTRDDDLEGLEE
ncbi:hypothetical protein DZA50_05090 [Kangiella sp. HD9-110m-PIT-SAG07]|nr:hypothetical protein DZA50_05090 [Kangiella sp. HD9-110m-PIT-SAG07]